MSPRPRVRRDKSRGRLTLDQDLALMFGISPHLAFANTNEARSAWAANRESILSHWGAGARPWAFWVVEAKEEQPDDSQQEVARLSCLGVLSRAEVNEIHSTYPLLAEHLNDDVEPIEMEPPERLRMRGV